MNPAIKLFGGERVINVYKGAIVCKWCDNAGAIHRFNIPNSYYVPDGKYCLLSPQQWAKTQVGNSYKQLEGTGETTISYNSFLFWKNAKYILYVYLVSNENVATFYLAPGYKKFQMFCQKIVMDYENGQYHPITTDK